MHTKDEALAECERCQGRQHGDCDSACRYWFDTASATERETEESQRPVPTPLTMREWLGPRAAGTTARPRDNRLPAGLWQER